MAVPLPSGQKAKAEPNVVPLCDVLLVLLIIFMVITPMVQKGIDIKLPETSSDAEATPVGLIVLTLKKDMTVERLKKIISQGEGRNVEFKSSSFELPRNIFESVCALLNRSGGDLILGVENDGTISGVFKDSIETIKTNFVNGYIFG